MLVYFKPHFMTGNNKYLIIKSEDGIKFAIERKYIHRDAHDRLYFKKSVMAPLCEAREVLICLDIHEDDIFVGAMIKCVTIEDYGDVYVLGDLMTGQELVERGGLNIAKNYYRS